MFERYTDRTRSVIFLSVRLARSRGSSEIEPEDLLAALILEDRRDFAETFPFGEILHGVPRDNQPFFSENAARSLLPAPDGPADPALAGKGLKMSGSLKGLLKKAAKDARRHKHRTIQPLHLLTAIVDDRESPLARRLLQCGISRQRVNEALERTV